MNAAEQATVVRAGTEPVGEERLRLMCLPDGRTGALRGGQVFPLQADGSIDIAGEFTVPGNCTPLRPEMQGHPAPTWTLVADDPPLLLIRGDEAGRDRLLEAVAEAGAEIRASGPYLAGIDEDEPFDWFALPAGLTLGDVEAALISGFGKPLGGAASPVGLKAAAAEREAILRAALDLLRAEARKASDTAAEMALRAEEAEGAWAAEAQARQTAENRLAATMGSSPIISGEPIRSQSRAAKRLADEVAEAIATLLPRLALLGGTLDALALGLRDRGPTLRAFRDLHDRPAQTLAGWKGVRGATAWREKHVSTGQDDSGRIYARQIEGGNVEVLLSFKGSQNRDIDWLARK